MCGITGIFDLGGQREIDREQLSRMNETQFHRGPDEGGIHTEPGVGFAHRRLSIIDLSSGQQPLFNEDGTVVVTYNGEIYNFPELSAELKQCGHQFKTHCDTEVIVHAWEEWGEACVLRFRGMFAFAIWDRNQQVLFMARDRLGVKPLYYAKLPNGLLLFGSELKSISSHPQFSKKIDNYAVEDYFAFGYVPEPRTIFSAAKKLSPGYSLLLRKGESFPQPKQYWDVPFTLIETKNEADIHQELRERLKEAVGVRLVAEVPLGAFLSGGVDSSAIVAMMAELSPNKPVNTCSIAFNDPKFNESEFADLVAKKFATNHFVDRVDSDDFALIDTLASLYDEPYADSSAIPTYRVCELAKKKVTVALSGDGGDEGFAGYRRYRWHMNEENVRNRLPYGIRKPLFGFLGNVYPKLDWAPKYFRAKSTFQALARNSIEAYMHSVSFLNDDLRQKMYSNKFKSDLQGYHAKEVFLSHFNRAPTDDPLSLIQYIDMKTYLAGDILTKVDRASMAHALEVRVPLLDHKFVEWVSGLPSNMKLRGQEGKHVFKKTLEADLPHNILYRSKMGFAVPLAKWFRGPLREKVKKSILSEHLSKTEIFEQPVLEKLVREHQSGVGDHSTALWTLMMFEAFVRKSIS